MLLKTASFIFYSVSVLWTDLGQVTDPLWLVSTLWNNCIALIRSIRAGDKETVPSRILNNLEEDIQRDRTHLFDVCIVSKHDFFSFIHLPNVYHLSSKLMMIQAVLCLLGAYLVPGTVLGAVQIRPQCSQNCVWQIFSIVAIQMRNREGLGQMPQVTLSGSRGVWLWMQQSGSLTQGCGGERQTRSLLFMSFWWNRHKPNDIMCGRWAQGGWGAFASCSLN